MNADIDKRPATLERFIGENAPPRHTAATQRLRGSEVNFTECAVHYRIAQELGVQGKAMMKIIRKDFSCLARRDAHLVGLFRRHCRRLFTHHMATRFESRHHMFKMEPVRRTDAHHIRFYFLQHLVSVLPCRWNGITFRERLCLLKAAVHDSHHLNITARGVIRGMHFVCNLPGANDGDAQRQRCRSTHHARHP